MPVAVDPPSRPLVDMTIQIRNNSSLKPSFLCDCDQDLAGIVSATALALNPSFADRQNVFADGFKGCDVFITRTDRVFSIVCNAWTSAQHVFF
jgi:hypothetical protein